MKIFKRIVAGILFVVCLVAILIIVTVPEKATENIAPAVVSLIVGVFLWISSNKKPKEKKEKKENNPKPIQVLHVEGLPLAEKTLCSLSLVDNTLVISGGGSEFVLNTSQIGAAEVKTDVEIAHIVTSSAAKGIAGGLLFGPIGLVVGSRAKSKEKRTATPYLILNYTNSEGVLSSMLFEASLNMWGLNKFLNNLRSIISNNPKQKIQM